MLQLSYVRASQVCYLIPGRETVNETRPNRVINKGQTVMAKKATKMETTPATTPTTGATAPVADKAAEKAAREARMSGDKFVRNFDTNGKGVEPKKKLAPQAQVIVNAIEAAGKDGVKRSELIATLGNGVDGILKTRQPAGRILTYYTKLITQAPEGETAPCSLVKA